MAKTRDTGWWYPYIFVGMFAVVLGVNGTLFYFANHSFTGLQTESAYDKGLDYNRVLAQEQAQRKLGWQVDARADAAAVQANPAGRTAELLVTWSDHDGQPLDGLDVKAKLLRPTVAGHDTEEITLKSMGKGKYGATVQLDFPGQWDMKLLAQKGENQFKTTQRILVP